MVFVLFVSTKSTKKRRGGDSPLGSLRSSLAGAPFISYSLGRVNRPVRTPAPAGGSAYASQWRLRPGRGPLAAPPLTNFYTCKTVGLACTVSLWPIWRRNFCRRLSMGGHGGPRPKRSELLRAPRADFWFFCSATKEQQSSPTAPYRGTHFKPFWFFFLSIKEHASAP